MALTINGTDVTKLVEDKISHHEGRCILMELPQERYFEVNLETIKVATGMGYSMLYISLHRPFKNLVSMMKEKGIDTEKVYFIDSASSQAESVEKENEKCIFISAEVDINELIRAVYKMLPRIKGRKCVFLDSVTTLAIYQPISETLRFTEFLTREIEKEEIRTVVFNVAQDLANKQFIKNIVAQVNETVKVG